MLKFLLIMSKFETLSEAVEELQDKGYNLSFELSENSLTCHELDKSFSPENFEIVGFHRFDGMTSPGDESVMYIIESTVGEHKGLLIDAYGVYSDSLSFEMIQKLRITYND